MNNFQDFSTMTIQSVSSKEGAISPSLAESASVAYSHRQTPKGIFEENGKMPLCSRMANPATARLKKIMAHMINLFVSLSGFKTHKILSTILYKQQTKKRSN